MPGKRKIPSKRTKKFPKKKQGKISRIITLLPKRLNDFEEELRKIEVDPAGVSRMKEKGVMALLKISSVRNPSANIIKQAMLSLGGDAAISKWALMRPGEHSDIVLIGTLAQIKKLPEKLQKQDYFGLPRIAGLIRERISEKCPEAREFRFGRKKITFEKGPAVMGVLNVTPDSFYDGGRYFSVEAAVAHALKLAAEGADILDIGGESTRPGSKAVSPNEEISRIIPVIKKVRQRVAIPISVDTRRYKVAAAALKAGASIINDVSAMTFDKRMASLAAQSGAGCIIMHMKGRPETMQVNPSYSDTVGEIAEFLHLRASALAQAGVKKSCISVDPGIGFGKTVKDNYAILNHIDEIAALGYPVTLGLSRKSFIGRVTGESAGFRLPGSIAAEAVAVFLGANIIRAHDVAETRQAVKIAWLIRNYNGVKER
ncbi:MAG: dihydropteroate synthase [Candidatus Aureabacteria bacterium]|nr:dihydropteroate synthase [Candidatus Auribacterota bacterium]